MPESPALTTHAVHGHSVTNVVGAKNSHDIATLRPVCNQSNVATDTRGRAEEYAQIAIERVAGESGRIDNEENRMFKQSPNSWEIHGYSGKA